MRWFGWYLAGLSLGSARILFWIAADRRVTWHAFAIIVVSGILLGEFGDAELWVSPSAEPGWGERALSAATASTASLALAAVLAFMLRGAAKGFGEWPATYGHWFRMVGFISAFNVLATVPVVGWIAATLYSLGLQVVATKELVDTTSGRAIAIVLFAQVGYVLAAGVLALLFAVGGSLAAMLVNPSP